MPRVMLLVFQPRSDETEQIVENVQARMFEVDVKFGVRRVTPAVEGYDARLAVAKQQLQSENLQLVIFWEESETDVLYYLLPQSDTPLRREIEYAGETRRPDAFAIISQTAVESLLDAGQLQMTSSQPPPAKKTPSPPPTPNTPKPASNSESRETPKPHVPHGDVRLGYELSIPGGAPAILHTGWAQFGIRPFSHIRFFAGAGVSSTLSSTQAEVEVRQRRIPIELGLAAVVEKNKIHMGMGGAFVLVPLKIDAQSTNSEAVLKAPYWGVGAMVKLNAEILYRVGRDFALYADLILLVNVDMVSYEVRDGPVLFDEYRRIWPGFQAGIAIYLF
ncbi:MAG: hypothetical protein JXX29_23355 [Deltaproteobacteria bacterium]|nr:hypothetical protein [Deltaproteobacteria bacterium]